MVYNLKSKILKIARWVLFIPAFYLAAVVLGNLLDPIVSRLGLLAIARLDYKDIFDGFNLGWIITVYFGYAWVIFISLKVCPNKFIGAVVCSSIYIPITFFFYIIAIYWGKWTEDNTITLIGDIIVYITLITSMVTYYNQLINKLRDPNYIDDEEPLV